MFQGKNQQKSTKPSSLTPKYDLEKENWAKRTLPSLTDQGLDFEINKLSKMVTSKTPASVIKQKIAMLVAEKSKRAKYPKK
jgi:hypothetical protein